MNPLRKALLTASAATLLASAASAVTLTFTPSADSIIRADTAGSNSGSATEILTGHLATTQALRGVLAFNLAALPDNVTINSVNLVLRQSTEDGSNNVAITLNLHLLTEAFVENQVSWNNRATGTAWTTTGGSFSSTVLSSASVHLRPTTALGGSLTLPIDHTWSSTANFVSAVQSVADSTTSSIIGFLLKDSNESNAARELFKFYSKESTGTSALAPQLIIDYSVAAIPEPSTAAALLGVVALTGCVWLRRRSS